MTIISDVRPWLELAIDGTRLVAGWIAEWQQRGVKVEEARQRLLHIDARARSVDADVDALIGRGRAPRPEPGDGE